MSDDDLWFLPGSAEEHDPVHEEARPRPPWLGPVPAREWEKAQAAMALPLARAAMAVGALDAVLGGDPGMTRRLALIEVEAMLWAEGTPVPREDIGRDLMMLGRPGTNPLAMARARWAIRRLEGQADPRDLRSFLGLHQVEQPVETGRVAGQVFDDSAEEFLALLEGNTLHPLTQAAMSIALWQMSGMSPIEDVTESATFAARIATAGLDQLRFVPLGQGGRAVWRRGGPPEVRLAIWLEAVEEGARRARLEAGRLDDWARNAREQTAKMKGDTPARVIAALRNTPLMTTEMVEQQIGASRDTAERTLARLHGMELVREITGTRRYRLWSAP